MKQTIIVLGFVVLVYIFTILTNQDTNVYNGISLNPEVIPAFSYEDATTVAESLE